MFACSCPKSYSENNSVLPYVINTKLTDRRPRREKFKRTIKLISSGYFNQTAFPNGNITVYPWDSTIDTWLTETVAKATGDDRESVLFDLMGQVCNLNGCAQGDFLLGEVNSILMTSRAIQNRGEVAYAATCPRCAAASEESISVPEELPSIGAKSADYKGTDKVILTTCQDEVEVRPLRIKDHLTVVTRTAESKSRITDHVASTIAAIVSIGGGAADSLDELVEWHRALPPEDLAQLEKFIDDMTPHLNQEIPHKCDKCGTEWNQRLVLDQDFFRSGRCGAPRRPLAANLQPMLGREGVHSGPVESAG